MTVRQHQTFLNAFKFFGQQDTHRSFILTAVKFKALTLATPFVSTSA